MPSFVWGFAPMRAISTYRDTPEARLTAPCCTSAHLSGRLGTMPCRQDRGARLARASTTSTSSAVLSADPCRSCSVRYCLSRPPVGAGHSFTTRKRSQSASYPGAKVAENGSSRSGSKIIVSHGLRRSSRSHWSHSAVTTAASVKSAVSRMPSVSNQGCTDEVINSTPIIIPTRALWPTLLVLAGGTLLCASIVASATARAESRDASGPRSKRASQLAQSAGGTPSPETSTDAHRLPSFRIAPSK